MEISAPGIQPIIACGPPIAASMIGIVMKGPMPIVSSMFADGDCSSPMPRTRRGVFLSLFIE
jgi:hypothetical protein